LVAQRQSNRYLGLRARLELRLTIQLFTRCQIASGVNAVIFDKTGTLTVGKPTVTDFEIAGGETETKLGKDRLLFFLGCAERSSEHPLGVAMVNYATENLSKEKAESIYSPSTFKAITGKGISCDVDGSTVFVGNRAFMILNEIEFSDEINEKMVVYENDGKTAVILAVNNVIEAVVAISDELKGESKATIQHLQKMGIEVWMVTGDNSRTAKAIGKQVRER